jgi:hypothetical protein
MDHDDREPLAPEEHLAFWGVPAGAAPPPTEAVLADIEHIFDVNLSLYNKAQKSGLLLCPIWEPGEHGAIARACTLPPEFFILYFEESEGDFREPGIKRLFADIVATLWPHLAQATHSFDDTLKLFIDPQAPVRSLRQPYHAHHMLLSTLLADWSRKAYAQLNIPEYLMSIGLLEEFYDPIQHGPLPAIEAAMNEKLEALWEQEDLWLQGDLDDE